jgi:hypothetical protein
MKLRASLLSAALLVGALPVALSTSVACAAESPHAALVVDTGGSEVALCVELPDESVSGTDLIRLAGEQHGLQYTFGYGGEAVCKLADVGPEGDDCFADYPNFWGYWHGDGSGGWTWSSTGAGSTTVEAGDVEGWSWGSGQDGSSHQQPPEITFEAVCGVPEEPGGETEPDKASMTDDDGDGGGAPADGGASGSSRPATESGDPPASRSRRGSEPGGRTQPKERDRSTREPQTDPSEVPEPTPEPEPHVALVAGNGESEEQGPPIAGFVGLGLAIGLGITAAAMTAARRRKS